MQTPDNKTSESTTEILVTTSIIVRASKDEDGGSLRMEMISDRLLSVVKNSFERDADVYAVGLVGYIWLEDKSINSGKCSHCNEWVTDRSLPNSLNGLPEAIIREDGNLVCDPCWSGEINERAQTGQR